MYIIETAFRHPAVRQDKAAGGQSPTAGWQVACAMGMKGPSPCRNCFMG